MFVFSSHTRPAHSETSPAALTTPALDRRSLRWFGISACTATPEDLSPSLAQHGSCRRSSTSSSSLPFRTHVGAGNSAVVVDLPRWGPMLSPRVPNLVPIPGPRMERETPGQRPRSNNGHPQGAHRCGEDLAAFGSEDLVEGVDKLAGAVAHERPGVCELVAVLEQQVPRRLGGPDAGGVVRDLCEVHGPGSEVYIAWSHPGRWRNEAAFARLAGVAPLEASSGRTPATASTAAATANSTARCTPSPSPAAATAPTPRPTSPNEPPKAKPPEKPNAASNATSPARSTASSNTPKSTLDKHRSIVSAKAQLEGTTYLSNHLVARFTWVGGSIHMPVSLLAQSVRQ